MEHEDIILLIYTIHLLLNLLDIFTTYIALRLGGAEGNPLVRKLIEKFGSRGMFLLKNGGMLAISSMTLTQQSLLAVLTISLFNIVLAGVVAWNSYIIVRLIHKKITEQS